MSEERVKQDEASSRAKLRATMSVLRARNADLSDAEVERLVDEELTETRKTFWATRRR